MRTHIETNARPSHGNLVNPNSVLCMRVLYVERISCSNLFRFLFVAVIENMQHGGERRRAAFTNYFMPMGSHKYDDAVTGA